MEKSPDVTIRTLKDLLETEELNLQASINGLMRKGIYQLAEDLDMLYETALKSLQVNAREVIIANFFLLTQLKFRVAIGLQFRCHTFEAASHIRDAIEAAGYAYVIQSTPGTWQVWSERKKDRKKFDETFKWNARFPKKHSVLSELGARYGLLSEFAVHANLDTFAGRLSLPTAGDACPEARLEYFDTDAKQLLVRYLYLLDTFLGVLLVFRECLSRHLSGGPWKNALRDFSKKFEAAKRKLRKPLGY